MYVLSISRAELLIEFCEILTFNGVSFVIVGDSSKFPNEINSDVDFICDNFNLKNISQLLYNFCNKNNIRLINILQHEQNAYTISFYWIDKNRKSNFLFLDLCSDYYRKGKYLLSANDLLENRKHYEISGFSSKSFFLPESSKAFIYYLLKRVDKLDFTSENGKYLSSQWQEDPKKSYQELSRFWSKNNANIIAESASTNDWRKVVVNLKSLKQEIHKSVSYRFKDVVKEIFRLYNRIKQPKGLFIVFLGSDGSGKSSVIKDLTLSVSPAFRNTKVFHFRPNLLNRKQDIQNGIPINPHEYKPRNILLSVMKLFYYYFDFLFGYFLKIKPGLIRSNLIIFDRYFNDIIIDNMRYRYKGPKWIVKVLNRLIPKPDMFFLLDAPESIIHSRKQELSISELKKQRERFHDLMKSISNGYTIDAACKQEDVVYQVEQTVINFLNERILKTIKP